jgi:hypothetical protein
MCTRLKSLLSVICVGAAALSVPLSAFAVPVSWHFAGVMDDTGNPFEGVLSFERDRPDTNTSSQRGQFTFGEVDLRIALEGNSIFAADTHADGRVPDWVAEADVLDSVDFRGDLFRFTSNVLIQPLPLVEGLQEFGVDLFFIDESGQWLSDALLPTAAPDLSSLLLDSDVHGWGDYFALNSPAVFRLTTSSGPLGQQFRYGTINSLAMVSVPEPATVSLLSIGLLVVLVRRRRKGVTFR